MRVKGREVEEEKERGRERGKNEVHEKRESGEERREKDRGKEGEG